MIIDWNSSDLGRLQLLAPRPPKVGQLESSSCSHAHQQEDHEWILKKKHHKQVLNMSKNSYKFHTNMHHLVFRKGESTMADNYENTERLFKETFLVFTHSPNITWRWELTGLRITRGRRRKSYQLTCKILFDDWLMVSFRSRKSKSLFLSMNPFIL